MSHRRSVWSRVGRLEGERRSAGGACTVCGGGGYPGTFVQAGDGSEPEQVGSWSCAGCGRVRVGAVVVLPGGQYWAGADDHGAIR